MDLAPRNPSDFLEPLTKFSTGKFSIVSMTVVQGTINCASLLAGSRSKEEMGGIARARDKDIILKSIAFVCRGDPNASLLLANARRQFLAPQVL